MSKPPSVTTITVGGTVRTVTAPTEPTASNDSSVVERMATPNSGEVSENRYAGTTGGSVAGTWDSQNKRRSHLMPVDPRLDPFATGIYPDQNRSRESFNSLQDNQDYSRRVHQPPRVLRAMNPDPDD